MLSLDLSRPDASIHVQHDVGPHMTVTWGKIMILTFQDHFIYGLTCLDETSTMVAK